MESNIVITSVFKIGIDIKTRTEDACNLGTFNFVTFFCHF